MPPDNVRASRFARGRTIARRLELVALLVLPPVWAGYATPFGEQTTLWTIGLSVLPGLVGFQHGFVSACFGIVSALSALWLGVGRSGAMEAVYVMAAPFLVALLGGYLRDRAESARRTLAATADAQQRKLEQLFRSHELLRASHAQLEERLAAQDCSLDAAVREATSQVASRALPGAAHALLELLSGHARVGAATLTLARGKKLPERPDAHLGALPDGKRSMRAIQRAFEHGALVFLEHYVVAPRDAAAEPLVAMPLTTTGGVVVGVLAIYDLPFVAFHEAHFRLIATLVGPFVDVLARKLDAGADRPDAPTPLPPPTRALAKLSQRAALLEGSAYAHVHPDELTYLTEPEDEPSVPLLLWPVRVDPAQERVDGAGLHPELPLAGEAHDQPLAAEEERLGATAEAEAGQGADLVVEGVFEGDHVAGVDHEVAVDGELEHGAVGVEEEVAAAAGGEQDEPVAGEEAARALPLGAQLDAVAAGEVGAALDEQTAAVEWIVDDVAGGSGGQHDLAVAALRGVGVQDQALAREHALDPTK